MVICPALDIPPSKHECDLWAQDCPEDLRCVPYSSEGREFEWDIWKCVPNHPDARGPGEPCEVSGPHGVDNCEKGLTCREIGGQSICVAMCTNSPFDPHCPAGYQCNVDSLGVTIACLPLCHPFGPDCGADFNCAPSSPAPEFSGFECIPVDPAGGEFVPCAGQSDCSQGLLCVDSVLAAPCDPEAERCCLRTCDLEGAACPAPQTACEPLYPPDAAPVGFDNIGLCLVQ